MRLSEEPAMMIHELFERQAAAHPDAIALISDSASLSYRALNEQANQLAHYLRQLGVQSETLVGLCLSRSAEMIVAQLAILKAGGAYLPLDPEYPSDRKSFILADARVSLLITQSTFPSISAYQGQLIHLDEARARLAAYPESNLAFSLDPATLAYVIYTSGSTGRPKGVQLPHQGLMNLCRWYQRSYQVTASDRTTLLAGQAFDASVMELWPALTCGASLAIPTEQVRLSPPDLLRWLREMQITFCFLPTPLAEAVLERLAQEPMPGLALRALLTGGDRLHRRPPADLGFELMNNYGPTENTVVTTWSVVAPGSDESLPNIGRPLDNVELYVLDADLQPVLPGEPGELHIGGAQVARGYLHRPDTTAEKFIPHPYSTTLGARLYKSGDLVRWLPDGTLDFIGRIDNQIKLRGFRIELGEIEAQVRQHPDVEGGVVLLREDRGDKRLVAYIVPRQQSAPEASELRRFLQDRLPEYMLPSAFVILDALPLTPNGKVDRHALPAPESVDGHLSESYVAPRTPTEELVAQIWAELLHLERVGAHDSFFELGGHSLLATQMLSRVRDALRVDLPLRTLFNAPTVAALAQEITQSHQGSQSLRLPPLHPMADFQAFPPLSFPQQRLWFLYQLFPDSLAYNTADAMRLRGALDGVALEGSLRALIQRHASLRTTFRLVEGSPRQIIAPSLPFTLALIDLQNLAGEAREAEMHRLLDELTQEPFDLTEGPLFRAFLLRLAPDDHVLLLNTHHIILDGWSVGVFMHELAALYNGAIAGETRSLPVLPLQYADFALWQREWLEGAVMEQQLAYWREQLTPTPPVLALPTDSPRPTVQRYQGAQHVYHLPTSLLAALKSLSQQKHVTLFMTLLSAFQTLLHRYSGQTDIAVGSPIANRTQSELEGLIGFFVNTLVMRTDLSGDPSFTELLERVREVALGAYAHQDLPFEKLVEALNPERNLSHAPLFQVLFVLQNSPLEALSLTDLTIEALLPDNGGAQFDLLLSIREDEQGLAALFQYNTDLFEAETIQRWAAHFHALLEAIAADPTQRLSRLNLLPEPERECLLERWNATESAYPAASCVHHLFAAQAARTPEATALRAHGKTMSYGALERRSNQMAHYLRSLGVGPDVSVGLCVERSMDAVVALLAILKAGGAYIPLDPSYPPERLSYMLANSAAPVLVTQSALAERLPAEGLRVLCLDREGAAIAQEPDSAPEGTVRAENLAYIIFTSGSMGQPKGVAMSHGPLCNLLAWQQAQSLRGGALKTLQFAPMGFDVSFQETFATLCTGGTLVVIEEATRQDMVALLHMLAEEQIERLFLPFVALNHLAEAASSSALSLDSLREVITAGEQLQITPAVESFFARWSDCTLHNHYGPTETHVASAFPLTGQPEEWAALPPIGRPIANVHLHILDEHFAPVPIGIPGELYIGGVALARGYLNRPDLTAERFVPDPFSAEPGMRLYRTGDLARYLASGDIEFLGRIDNQVKIRGFRVELGEIETILAQHPRLREAVVVAREAIPGLKQLVAYLVSADEQPLTLSSLRYFLLEHLPEYMVPSVVVWLKELPLSPNGKVDRRALPTPEGVRPDLDTHYEAPRTPVEEVLCSLWVEVLRLEQIGIRDDFFELGGHSLLATQLVAQIEDYFQVSLPLRTLFEARTVASLAEALIRLEPVPGQVEETARLLQSINEMSPEELALLLEEPTDA